MRLLVQDPNPLNVLDIRELDTMPIHFEKLSLKIESWNYTNTIDNIRDWIYNNLNGRFAIIQDLYLVDNKMENVYQIGFEDASEVSYFSLACSVLATDQVKIV